MNINYYSEAQLSYNILKSISEQSRRQYEINVANGSDVHNFYNKINTVQASLDLLKLNIDYNVPYSVVQRNLDRTRRVVYELVEFVGERMKYYSINKEDVF